MPFLLVYGTLRKGHYNNKRFPMVHMKDIDVPGFQLYDLGSYPMVIKTDNPEDIVKMELFQVTATTEEYIDAMEYGAGYDKVMVPVNDPSIKEAGVYFYHNIPSYAKLIEHGDYTKFCKDKEQARFTQSASPQHSY